MIDELLSATERDRLADGEHEAVAAGLEREGRHLAAARIREQIWDFAAATHDYLLADQPFDALRAALETADVALIERVLVELERVAVAGATIDPALEILRRRRRHGEVARLLAAAGRDALVRARAHAAAGDPIGAARILLDGGFAREALAALGRADEDAEPRIHALAAQACWALGDALGCARHAQVVLRDDPEHETMRRRLTLALAALGHDHAARMLAAGPPESTDEPLLPGRYRVSSSLPTALPGSAYLALDRATLEEVEVHLLLADSADAVAPAPQTLAALRAFAARARAAAELDHPSILPLRHFDPDLGLLVIPRAPGPLLSSVIHPPGMPPTAARALVRFLAEGLAAAHERGLPHGGLLPSQIGSDAVGRPLLGPFGTDLLRGLQATRTGGLHEMLGVTAPEVRGGAPATAAADVHALGALLLGLLCGRIDPGAGADGHGPEQALARSMMAADPSARPTMAEIVDRLGTPVDDVAVFRSLGVRASAEPPTVAEPDAAQGPTPWLTAAQSWPDALLDELAASDHAWLQPILDRNGRSFQLSPWPAGCATSPRAAAELVGGPELAGTSPALAAALARRLGPFSVVVTATGERMLALDDLLSR